ncbi:MAG: serine acetyltransferase, partial [Cyanobacteria bacterium J06632_19]
SIGDRANIGANAVVLRDIPSSSTAVGIPAKILTKELSGAQ